MAAPEYRLGQGYTQASGSCQMESERVWNFGDRVLGETR